MASQRKTTRMKREIRDEKKRKSRLARSKRRRAQMKKDGCILLG